VSIFGIIEDCDKRFVLTLTKGTVFSKAPTILGKSVRLIEVYQTVSPSLRAPSSRTVLRCAGGKTSEAFHDLFDGRAMGERGLDQDNQDTCQS
jgi:hypothetical protein